MKTSDRGKRGRSAVTVGAVAVALVASGTLVALAATPPPAHINNTVGLKRVGPIDETNGFPLWYQDTTGTRLELCTDPGDANCIVGAVQSPGQPVVFPSNFPDEAFYSNAGAALSTGAGKAKLVTGIEAAFATGGPAVGQQITFGRIRVVAGGLIAGADYTVTDPYGTETFTAADAGARGIFDTKDIGSLTPDGVFDQTIAAKAAPFLRWPAGSGAPAGYLGDPAVNHVVTGSPFNTNFFRMEGPVGSFTGSPDLCADATLGASTTSTTDCIETNLFSVAGKIATHGGVQVTKAYYETSGTGHLMDLFAYSTPGQNLVVSGTGVSQTKMREDAASNGKYFARVFADGPPPTDLKVTNTTDAPNSVDHVQQAMFGDRVHVTSAVYSNDTHNLSITAQSGDQAATLSVEGLPGGSPVTAANGAVTWTFPGQPVPPDDVTVTSDRGGVGTEDVVITGADDPSAAVVATITGDTHAAQVGQNVSLDALASAGTITSYSWSVTPANGASLNGANATGKTFNATAPGTYTVKLTVTGAGAGNTSSDTWVIDVSDPAACRSRTQVPTAQRDAHVHGHAGRHSIQVRLHLQLGADGRPRSDRHERPEERDHREPDIRHPRVTDRCHLHLQAHHHRRQRNAVDGLRERQHRPGRRHGRQRHLQAGRSGVAGPGIGPVLLGQQRRERLLEQARWHLCPPGNNVPDGGPRCLHLRLPAQEHPRGPAGDRGWDGVGEDDAGR